MTAKERVTIRPLTLMDIGVETTVKAIRGKDQTRKFLQNLGFVVGAKVLVLSSLSAPLLFSVKPPRLPISLPFPSLFFLLSSRSLTPMSSPHTLISLTLFCLLHQTSLFLPSFPPSFLPFLPLFSPFPLLTIR